MLWEKRGETFFCFPFNCRSPDTLTCIISISQKKDFLPLLFKNEISRRKQGLLQLLSLQTMFTLQEGEDEKQEQRFFKCRRRALQFLKGNSTALTDIIQWDLWWGVFQNAVKAFGAGFCGAPLWVAAAGNDQESRPLLLEAWEEDGSKLLGGCLLEDCFQELSFFWKWRPLFHQRETWESSFCKRRKEEGWILHIYGSWEQSWSLDFEFEVGSSSWYRTR